MSRFFYRRVALSAGVLFAVDGSLRAFEFIGSSWPNGDIVMHLQLGSPAAPLIDGATEWASVAESALNEWNQHLGRAKFTVVRDSSAAIARGNRINNVVFSADIYGDAFDSRTLAVTLGGTSLTSGVPSERDVLFNSNRTWNSYRGNLRNGTVEFRRVALHEFGHVLGLDHPDQAEAHFQTVTAVMNSTMSDIETLRTDDIAGVRALYDVTPTRTFSVGDSFTFGTGAAQAGSTYTWYFRGANSALPEPFRLATGPNYTVGSLQLADAGTYTAMMTTPAGAFVSRTEVVTIRPVGTSNETVIANISTRGVVDSGNGLLIAGLVIGGTTPKNVLVRAAGPALTDFGVSGALADPTLKILDGQSRVVLQNDNWETGGNNSADISGASARLGAFSFKSGSRDAALLALLPPGNYTAIVSGVNDTTGIALVEAYDADPDPATARTRKLVNIATRGQVNTGDNVLIAGLVVAGPGPRTFLIRAVGITLTRTPFNVSDGLRDPFLQIYQGDRLLRENDDWDAPVSAMPGLRDAARQVGAFALQETRSNSGLDSAMLITLQPGSYTAKVSGFQGATGVALVEIYEMP